MSAKFDSSVSIAQRIPREILLKIFTDLQLCDLRSVRASCKWWYEVCRDQVLRSKECAILQGNQPEDNLLGENIEYQLSVLQKINANIQHIRFENCQLDYEAAKLFWPAYGPKLLSMSFNSHLVWTKAD